MATLRHSIRQQTLDIEVDTEAVALALQPRIGDINRRRFLPVIERVLDELAVPGQQIRISRLEIDLGELPLENFEQAAEDSLYRELLRSLEKALRDATQSPSEENWAQPAAKAKLDMLDHYLLRGTLPFWAPGESFSVETTVLELAKSEPADLVAMIRRHAYDRRVLERIATQLGDASLENLLRLLAPEHAVLILAYMVDLNQIHRTELLLNLSDKSFTRLLWVLVLSYVLRDPGTQFNRKSFVRSLLEGVAKSESLDYLDLVATLWRGLRETEKHHSLASSLPSVIHELVHELSPEMATRADFRRAEGKRDPPPLALFEQYLLHGILPVSEQSGSALAAEEFVRQLLEDDPQGARELLRKHGREATTVRRIVEPLGDALLQRLLLLLEPGYATLIIAYMIDLRNVHEIESLLRLGDKEFARLLWVLVFSYVLRDPGSQFNRRSFVRSLLERMAQSESLDYVDLVGRLRRAVHESEKSLSPASSLLAVVREVLRDLDPLADVTSAGGVASAARHAFIWLEHYLVSGEVPTAWIEAPMGDPDPRALLRFVIAQGASETANVIRRLARRSNRDAIIRRLLHALAPGEVLALLAPEHQTAIIRLIKGLSEAEPAAGVAPVRDDVVWPAAFEYLLGRSASPPDFDAMAGDIVAVLAKHIDAPSDPAARAPRETQGSDARNRTVLAEYAEPAFRRHDQIEILRYYLHHGILPWSAFHRDVGLSVEMALASLSRLSIAQLRAIFAEEGAAEREQLLLRAVHALPEASTLELLLRLLPQARQTDSPIRSALATFADRAGDKRAFYAGVLAAILDGHTLDLEELAASAPTQMSSPRLGGGSGLHEWEAHALKSMLMNQLRRDGSVPADAHSSGDLLQALITRYPNDARQFLHAIGDVPELRAALLRQIPPMLLQSGYKALWPALAGTLQAFFRTFATLPLPDRPRLEERENELVFGALLRWEGDLANVFARLLRDLFGTPVPDEVRRLLSGQAAAWQTSGELPAAHIGALEAAIAGPSRASAVTDDRTSAPWPVASRALQQGVFAFLLGEGAGQGFAGDAAAARLGALSEDTLLHALRGMIDGEADEVARFVHEHIADRARRERWVKVLPDSALVRFSYLLEPRQHRALLDAAQLLASAWEEVAPGRRPSVGREALWSFLFDFFVEHPSIDRTLDRLVAAFVARIVGTEAPLALQFLEHAGRLAHAAGHSGLLAIVTGDHAVLSAPQKPSASAATTARSVEARPPPQAERASHRPVHGKTAFQLAMEKNDEQRGEPIYIGNAGLVLTSPFLPHLFQTLDLLTKDDDGRPCLRSSDALSRAVHLLQYLVDGRTSAPEPLLILNKLLCGVPTQTPVARAIDPTDDEQALCQRLLGSMIANWTIIANTSIAGLRGTFLQREGKLQRTADGWKLRVQRKTLDVLVDQIPWSISVTYHPWMPQPLLVTW